MVVIVDDDDSDEDWSAFRQPDRQLLRHLMLFIIFLLCMAACGNDVSVIQIVPGKSLLRVVRMTVETRHLATHRATRHVENGQGDIVGLSRSSCGQNKGF